MALLPLFFGGPQRYNRYGIWDEDLNLAPFASPFHEVNRALSEMDNAMRFVNRQVNRLSGPSGLMDQSPLRPDIIEEGGNKKIQYNFNVRGFKPEDITLKTREGQLIVSAKTMDEGEDHRFVREFHRMMLIPEGVKVEDLTSRLMSGGVLQVEAPYTPPAIEAKKEEWAEIPITHEPSTQKLERGRGEGSCKKVRGEEVAREGEKGNTA